MSKASLVIMAAGIGSRFGEGIKQFEIVGPKGESIIDYSIYDAIEAGFDKIVFVTRKDIYRILKIKIGDKIAKKVEVKYVFQEIEDVICDNYIGKFYKRSKPWGTGHAILMCKDIVKEPFLVINADDYYGKESFKKIYTYLTSTDDIVNGKFNYVMVGYCLKNTLSNNGKVTRGIIQVDNGYMSDIKEIYNIYKKNDQAIGDIETSHLGVCSKKIKLDLNIKVSMNMWGLRPSIFDILKDGFINFLSTLNVEDPKGEYLLPIILGEIVKNNKARISVIETNDKWFGITYASDVSEVKHNIKVLIEKGYYNGI